MTTVSLAAAEEAVREIGARLAADLPFEERWQVAREHEKALLERAQARRAAGVRLSRWDLIQLDRADRLGQGGGA
ncbi:hypothetical protein ACWELB_21095 [Streptomyces asiaticus]